MCAVIESEPGKAYVTLTRENNFENGPTAVIEKDMEVFRALRQN